MILLIFFLGLIVLAFLLVLRFQGYGMGGWWAMIALGQRRPAPPDAGRSPPPMAWSPWTGVDEDAATRDPPTEDPPTEDPPTEDAPTEDAPTEDAAAAAARREAEFADFYRTEFSVLVGFVINSFRGINYHDAANAAQDAMIQAWKKWDDLINPKAWVRTVAIRKVYRFYRSSWCSKRADGDPSNCPALKTPNVPIEWSEQTEDNLCFLAVLPPKQRIVFILKMEGFPTKEIANMLKMNEDAVRQNLRRAREALKKQLKKREEDGDEHPTF